MTTEFDAIKEELREKHKQFIALLMVLRENGLSADVAAQMAIQLAYGEQPDETEEVSAAMSEREAAARRVETGTYDIDVTAVDSYDDVVKMVVRQAADHVRCGLGRTT